MANPEFTNPFERMYDAALTPAEIEDITSNLCGFFEVLIQIDKELKQKGSYENPNNRSTNSAN